MGWREVVPRVLEWYRAQPELIIAIAACVSALAATMVCVGCIICRRRRRRAGGGPRAQQSASAYLGDIGRASLAQSFMRQSLWPQDSAPNAEHEPLLSPALTPSTRLLQQASSAPSTVRSSPLVSARLRAPPPTGSDSPFRMLTGALSGARRGAQDLINNDSYHEAEVEEDPIACGATGDVVRGVWRGKQMAIKVLQIQHRSLSREETAHLIESFRREVTICCQVQHQNLVNFYGYTTRPVLRICMEFVPGGALDAALYRDDLATGRRWVPTHQQVLEVALGVAQGMAHLHWEQVIHRDIKSPNVLLDTKPAGPWHKTQNSAERAPVPRITDFGLSRELPQQHNQRMTMNLKVGTPVWMSPELLDKQAEYSNKVDLYSYAVVLTELLSCELPWRSLGPDQLTQAVLHERRRPAIAADTPDVLREVVEACWRHDPLARPTFDQVVELLNYGLDDSRLTPQVRAQMLTAETAVTRLEASSSEDMVEDRGRPALRTSVEIGGAE